MEKEKLKLEFKKFLKENNAYYGFLSNIVENSKFCAHTTLRDYLNKYDAEKYLFSAFVFADTPEGNDYWYSLHMKWLERLKSLEEKSVKPPVGLRPRFVDDIRRMDEIKKAVIRYVKDGWEVPPEWIEEYNELAERYPSNSINH